MTKITLPRRKKKSNLSLWIMLALIALILAIMFLLPSCGSNLSTEQTTLVKEGTTAPDFTVEMYDGQWVTLSALRGKVVLVNFWATWCPPCREELSHVQTELIDRFAGREFVFLPISRGEERATVETFRQSTGYTFPMGLDPDQAIYNQYASNYIPRNFLIDQQGQVIYTSIGYEPEEFAELVEKIAATLDK